MLRHSLVLMLMLAVLQGIAPSPVRAQPAAPAAETHVLKVVVSRAGGVTELGSAVAIVGERLVTNCHVIRDAQHIEIEMAGGRRAAIADLRDTYRDLCFLTLPGMRFPPVPMIDTGATRVGMNVVAAGYAGGRFAVSEGKVIGLHTCECDGGRVIQTSAAFDRGASGGGLFDPAGRLVGILSFKSSNGGNFHFALPVGWLRHMASQGIESISGGSTFWEKPGRESSYFLAACDLGARENWRALSSLAGEWSVQEPNNPEAWMALGRARLGLRQNNAAVIAFQTVLMLDSTHAEAKWALQELEVELGRSLFIPDGV